EAKRTVVFAKWNVDIEPEPIGRWVWSFGMRAGLKVLHRPRVDDRSRVGSSRPAAERSRDAVDLCVGNLSPHSPTLRNVAVPEASSRRWHSEFECFMSALSQNQWSTEHRQPITDKASHEFKAPVGVRCSVIGVPSPF